VSDCSLFRDETPIEKLSEDANVSKELAHRRHRFKEACGGEDRTPDGHAPEARTFSIVTLDTVDEEDTASVLARRRLMKLRAKVAGKQLELEHLVDHK